MAKNLKELYDVIELLIPSWKLNYINPNEELKDAEKIVRKYPEILNGCLIPENKRFSNLKYYFGAAGDFLIKNGIKSIKIDLPKASIPVILGDKVGKSYKKREEQKTLIDFIKENE